MEKNRYFLSQKFTPTWGRFLHGRMKKVVRLKGSTDYAKNFNSLLNNAKWFFIAQCIEKINEGNDDFSEFNYDLGKYNIQEMMHSYFDQATRYSDNKIELSRFKTTAWYENIKTKIDMDAVVNGKVLGPEIELEQKKGHDSESDEDVLDF